MIGSGFRGSWGTGAAGSGRAARRALARVAGLGLSLPIRAYRLLLSPWVGRYCRFQPTCSAYALEAIERHGALRGGWLTVHRLMRCRPGADWGFDPVPGSGAAGAGPERPATERPPR